MNLDSLLDTLTNVMGFLIIILAVMQLNVKHGIDSVKRSSVETIVKDLHSNTNRLNGQIPSLIRKVEAVEDKNQTLESGILSSGLRKSFKEELNDNQQRYESLKDKIESDRQALRFLEEKLGKTDAESHHESLELPDIRIMEHRGISREYIKTDWKSKSKIIIICCRKRIFNYDYDRYVQIINNAIENNIGNMLRQNQSEQEKVKIFYEYFSSHEVGDEYLEFKIQNDNLVLDFRDSARGESIESLINGNSNFENQLKNEISPENNWIEFRVWDDSFEIYLAARRITDRYGYRAGWIPFATDQVVWNLSSSGSSGFEQGPEY